MKKYTLVFCKCVFALGLCLSAINTYGQTEKKNSIGSHIAFGSGLFHNPKLIGGGRYDTKYYYTIGLDYSRMLSRHWEFCSGLEYTYNDMTVAPAPGIGGESIKENIELVTIPAQVKYHFGKYFFVNGGLFFNVAARIGSDHWIGGFGPTRKLDLFLGCGLGAGFQYEFNSGLVLTLNPYIRWNGIENVDKLESLFKFMRVSGNIYGFQFRQSGVSLGVGYKF